MDSMGDEYEEPTIVLATEITYKRGEPPDSHQVAPFGFS
jgi:hypothetical protein